MKSRPPVSQSRLPPPVPPPPPLPSPLGGGGVPGPEGGWLGTPGVPPPVPGSSPVGRPGSHCGGSNQSSGLSKMSW
ncbi:MAG: hypothetical protein EA398_13530 [Deltaproteobacteria bacterium]|nr:MAG: hypothetical protein EA398_13530 [Deltaproteobacteria bacterium]